MSAAYLFSVCSVHGIDLKHVAGASSNTKGAARRRRLTAEERKRGARAVSLTATGTQTRTYRPPSVTVADLALAGVPHIPSLACFYSFCRDKSVYWELWSFLGQESKRLMRRDQWPATVIALSTRQPVFYHDKLASLVLDSEFDEFRSLFVRYPDLYAWYMDIDPVVWNREVIHRYTALRARYESWLQVARMQVERSIAGYLRQPEPRPA